MHEIKQQQKTRMCKFENNCFKFKQGNNCSFAHSKKELFVPRCRFGYKCRNKSSTCSFNHDSLETVINKPCKYGYECRNKRFCVFFHEEPKIELVVSTPIPKIDSLKEFPNSLKNDSKTKNIFNINYKEIKKYIDFADFIVIKEKNIKDMIKEYGFIKDFKKVSFVF